MYGALTDRKAVLAALAEFDQLGRAEFLKKYGFATSRQYFVLHDGRLYDSKAIVGAAHGFQHGRPLSPYDFSGGKYTVRPKLKNLGFAVVTAGAVEEFALPEEIENGDLQEGGTVEVRVNKYERNREARKQCISAHGTSCAICGFDFSVTYGDEFSGFIHVHHIVPLAKIGSKVYNVDPKADLIPVCPNCHAVIHFGRKTRSVAAVKALLSDG